MYRKYECTEECRLEQGVPVRRIRALRDFDDVKAGDLGGWIEKELNLSHYGICWVYDDAVVCHDARVYTSAKIRHHSKIYGTAKVSGTITIGNYTNLCGTAIVSGSTSLDEFQDIQGMSESEPEDTIEELDNKQVLELHLKQLLDWNTGDSNLAWSDIEQIRKNAETYLRLTKYLDSKKGF